MSSTASRPAPPKPWEKAGVPTGSNSPLTSSSGSASSVPKPTASATTATSSTSGSAASPALPPRPAEMSSSTSAAASMPSTSTALANTYNSSSYLNNRMGSYGGYGSTYGSAYSSPYSRFGASGYGGYGGYGAGYGGYGAPFGGFGPQNDMTLTRQMESGTAATFQLLQSVVSAFGGFAQMLESTFMATHSSFFAMIGVAEQLTNLRNWLGEVLSVFALWRLVKRLLGRGDASTSGADAAEAASMSAAEFAEFQRTGRTTPAPGNGQTPSPQTPKPSKKPLIIFFLTVVGLPWLMSKLVKLITARQEAEARRLGLPEGFMPPVMGPDGQPLPQHMQPPGVDLAQYAQIQQQQAMHSSLQPEQLDPSKLTFVRATHAYASASNDDFELNFEKNDIIAVLTPKEERHDPGWWRGRLRNGKIGWFPSTHVQVVPMPAQEAAPSSTTPAKSE